MFSHVKIRRQRTWRVACIRSLWVELNWLWLWSEASVFLTGVRMVMNVPWDSCISPGPLVSHWTASFLMALLLKPWCEDPATGFRGREKDFPSLKFCILEMWVFRYPPNSVCSNYAYETQHMPKHTALQQGAPAALNTSAICNAEQPSTMKIIQIMTF